jgi:crossover junction endodeoxyribonuclease RuvC
LSALQQNPNARILGIDPGTQRCGYGLIAYERTGRKIAYLECGVLEPNAELSMEQRLWHIFTALGEIIEEYRPTVVAVEGAFFGKNARSALKLGQARGIALLAAAERELTVFEYAPATVKRAVTGRGGATKEQVQSMVRHLCALGRPPRLDASDALALAITHAFASRLPVRSAR